MCKNKSLYTYIQNTVGPKCSSSGVVASLRVLIVLSCNNNARIKNFAFNQIHSQFNSNTRIHKTNENNKYTRKTGNTPVTVEQNAVDD